MRKRCIQAVFTAMAVITALTGCAGTPAQTDTEDGLSLNAGIAQIAQEIERGLPSGTRVAVVNLESPSARFSDFVLEELQGYLIGGKKLVVTERSKLELLRNELTFQMSGDVSDESAVSIGRWLGAQVIITGSLTDMGGAYRCRFNAIDIETAVRRVSPAVTIGNDRTVAYMLPASAAPPPAQVPPKPDPSLVAAYFNSGFAHYEAGRYTEAVADFTRALAVTQNDEASLRYRALSYYYLKDYDRTITDMSRLIQMNSGNEESYLTRGAAYGKKGEYDKEIADYNQALRLNPDFAEAYNNRSAAYGGKGEYDRAIADCNQALRLNPNYAEPYLNRGNAYDYKGEHDRAIADFNQALRLNPNYTEAYYNRGNAYNDKGEYDRAIADYNQALRLNPNFAEAYNNRGNAYVRKGEYDRAIADYTQALRLNSNFAEAYTNRGVAYAMKEDYARARTDWEKALQLNPNDFDTWNNLEVLRGMGY
ncbi:MAG: tetratricopeptide repeat protein [Treponema sp.]|nr:tetratricopeptide repeat protein [Treponema sp.]